MPDPVTIGALAAWALGAAADALSKGVLEEAAKDAYRSLKERISQWANTDVAALEKAPTSKSRKAVIAEVVDAQSERDRESLRGLIQALIDQLKGESQTIGLDIGTLTNVETDLKMISVTQPGIGVRINDASGGKLIIGQVNVGAPEKNRDNSGTTPIRCTANRGFDQRLFG
jgi:hypothetical protein